MPLVRTVSSLGQSPHPRSSLLYAGGLGVGRLQSRVTYSFPLFLERTECHLLARTRYACGSSGSCSSAFPKFERKDYSAKQNKFRILCLLENERIALNLISFYSKRYYPSPSSQLDTGRLINSFLFYICSPMEREAEIGMTNCAAILSNEIPSLTKQKV